MKMKDFEKLEENEKTCTLCDKEMSFKEFNNMWQWTDEPAHSECVIMKSNVWCENCLYFSIDSDEDCPDCGKDLKTLNVIKKAELVKKHPNCMKVKE